MKYLVIIKIPLTMSTEIEAVDAMNAKQIVAQKLNRMLDDPVTYGGSFNISDAEWDTERIE